MIKKIKSLEHFRIIHDFLRWVLISFVVAIFAGSMAALFLTSLEWVTNYREGHVLIIALLPVAGFLIGWTYHHFGKSIEAGTNLILEELHDPKEIIPLRMAPLVFLGTVATHLFGGSAGREGTAVQMGGSIADQLTRPLKLSPKDRRILIMAGMSAGFGAVFGTPFAGAIFGLEVLSVGSITYESLLPCFFASVLADRVALAWGIRHTNYPVGVVPDLDIRSLLWIIVSGIAFGIVANLFSQSTHGLSRLFKNRVTYAPLRPFIGGLLVTLIVWGIHSTRFIGLGIPVIVESFTGQVGSWDFLWKFLLTALTLGAGFKGGEVTPLFFIGATLGNSLSGILPLPAPVLAAMGFVAVFSGAANTPLTSTFMAFELFGPKAGIFAGLACVVSFLFSGHGSIYQSQNFGSKSRRQDD